MRAPANAVRTITRQNDVQNHGVGTFFLRFAGFNQFTIATAATASAFTSKCHYDGIIADGQVKLSAQNGIYNDYCIHGERGIDASHDNYFEAPLLTEDGEYELDENGNIIDSGAIASMKDFDDCGPSYILCWSDANPNLSEVLTARSLTASKVTRIDDYLAAMYSNLLVDGCANMYIDSLLYAGAKYSYDNSATDTDSVFTYARPEIQPITIGPQNPFDISMLK